MRRHDRARLNELVSDRLLFVTGRALGRLGKEDWIAAALDVEWESFEVSISRVVALDEVVVIDHDIEQVMKAPPAGRQRPRLGPVGPQPMCGPPRTARGDSYAVIPS